MKIILIEDDVALAQLLTGHLQHYRYVVERVEDGILGLDFALATHADLLILDVELPRLDGFQLCQQLRNAGIQTPILLLSARQRDKDKVKGLEAGADDYLVKPFSLTEFLARVQALLRRPPVQLGSRLTWGPISLNTKTYEVSYAGRPMLLRPKEYKLMECLLRYQDQVCSYERLFDHIWSLDEIASKESLKAHIKGVRQALRRVEAPEDLIQVVRGIGIRLNPDKKTDPDGLESDQSGTVPEVTPDAISAPAQPSSPLLLPQIQAAWGQFRPLFVERIQTIERALRQWQSGELTASLRQQAQKAAHALAGSLGTFGHWQGSEAARQLEAALLTLDSFQPQRHAALVQQTIQLQHLLRQAPVSLLPPPAATTPASPILALGLDPTSVESLQTLLHPLGIPVVSAGTVPEAKGLLSQTGAALMLLAIEDPVLEGEALRWAAQQRIPVVFCAQHDTLAQRVRAAHLGALGVLPYPFQPENLTTSNLVIKMIRRVISMPLSPSPKLVAVDDDPLFLDGLRQRLERQVQLKLLMDPGDFWQIMCEDPPDICLIDIKLPSFSGFELCQAVRSDARFDQVPVVLITGYPDPAERLRARQMGASDYLIKAIDMDQLWLRLSPFLRIPYTVG